MASISANLTQTATSYTHVLTGTRDITVTTVYVDGSSVGVIYPTPTTWQIDVQLSVGENTFSVYGDYATGATTPTIDIVVTLFSLALSSDIYYNQFDEFAALAGLERLPGEKNIYLRSRIVDASTNKANATYEGLINGWNRELSLKVIRDAITFAVNKDTYGEYLAQDVYLTLTPENLIIEYANLETTENLQVDPGTLKVALIERPVAPSQYMIIETYDGNFIPQTMYEVDALDGSIYFNYAYAGEWITVYYRYVELINIRTITLQQLKTAVEAVVDSLARPIFSVTLNAVTTLPASGLVQFGKSSPTTVNNLVTDFSHIRIVELHDQEFKNSYLSDGHLYGTQVYKWAKYIRQKANYTWKNIQLDVDIWDPTGGNFALDFLPHLFDTRTEYWTNEAGTIIDYKKYLYNGGFDFTTWNKLGEQSPGEFVSGVGGGYSLKIVDVVESDT